MPYTLRNSCLPSIGWEFAKKRFSYVDSSGPPTPTRHTHTHTHTHTYSEPKLHSLQIPFDGVLQSDEKGAHSTELQALGKSVTGARVLMRDTVEKARTSASRSWGLLSRWPGVQAFCLVASGLWSLSTSVDGKANQMPSSITSSTSVTGQKLLKRQKTA